MSARTDLWSPTAELDDPAGWPERADRIRGEWDAHVAGRAPAVPLAVSAEPRPPGGDGKELRRAHELLLAVTPLEGLAPLKVRVLTPETAPVPSPVLLLPSRHTWWAGVAVRRGWAVALVSATDFDDDTDAWGAAVAPAVLRRRAWAYSAALTALAGVEGIDAGQAVLAGHSRDGKTALLAAAHDQRFTAVVSSSSGVLGAMPARLLCDRHFGEGIELLTRHYPAWYLPELREFSGREHELPTDAHELLALSAPRPVLVSVAVNDQVESTWAAERSVDAARDAWALLGAPDALELSWRSGGHELSLEDFERHLDFADRAVGKPAEPAEPTRRLQPVGTWARWPVARAPDPPIASGRLPEAIATALGPAPPEAATTVAGNRPERQHVAALLRRAYVPPGVQRERVLTGEGLSLDLYAPSDGRATEAAPLRLVLWLGPPCRALGYVAGYEQAEPMWEALARDGWAVACHDPVGAGARVREEGRLPARYPGWSPLGRMVHDAREVLDAARTPSWVAGGPAWLAGYAAGAVVALHLAALEPERVAGVALTAPTCDDALLAAPPGYGLVDLLGALGDRPALLLDPAGDPLADPGAVAAAAQGASATRLRHERLDDFHRLGPLARDRMRDWLAFTHR